MCESINPLLLYLNTVNQTFFTASLKNALPFEAVALLPPLIKVSLEAERSSGCSALSFGVGAEHRRPLQLRSHGFGVSTEVTGTGTVWELVPKELGDGGMAATEGQKKTLLVKSLILC